MNFLARFYSIFANLPYLFNTPLSTGKKINIFFITLWINIKHSFGKRTFKKQSFLGMKVTAFDYSTIRILFEELFLKNEYLFTFKGDAPVIFDCGANIGFATLYFKWLFPKSKVFVFEPGAEAFQMLKKNVEKNNLKDVYLYNAALSDKTGEISFYVVEDKPGVMGMSTVKDRIVNQKEVIVKCTTIGDVMKEHNLQKVDFLKMDIEGAEDDVVKNLLETKDLQKIDRLRIEYHHNIKNIPSRFGLFLQYLEKGGFSYQLDARFSSVVVENQMQNVLVHAYQND